MFNATARPALTLDQLRKIAPSVFAQTAHESRSERYAYIPTIDVLQAMQREGFAVYSAVQSRCRSADKVEFTKHSLRLRHADMAPAVVGESIAEIVLVNSHDGSSAYQLMGGMHRFVCANGMTVPDGICQTVRVPHTGDVRHRVTAGAFDVLDGLTRVIESRDAMRALTLTRDEEHAMARAAIPLRFDLAEGESAPVLPEQITRARRMDDRGSDLWTSFNRMQENLVRGGLRSRSATGQRRSTRAVTGIDQDIKLNRALWTLAEEMRRLKVAA
jgi:hypothetical protein